jgi:hypothetical protein
MNPVDKILGKENKRLEYNENTKKYHTKCKYCGRHLGHNAAHQSNKGGRICTDCVVSHGLVAGDNWVQED